MDGPAANTRSRKRARESDSTNDAPVNQAADTSPQKKRLKLNVGKPKRANPRSGKGGKKSSDVSSAEGEQRPAKPASETEKSGKPRKGHEDTQKEDEKGSELPLAYPQMPKPDLRNSHVLPEHLEKRLMVANLKDAKVRRLMEDWKPAAECGMAGIRRDLWRATRRAIKDRDMSNWQWESDYWVDTDADGAKEMYPKIMAAGGVPEGDKELLGEKEWQVEHDAWERLINQLD